jgi:hypothetical protein
VTVICYELILFRDEVTRHHYYLQLRCNVQSRGLLHANSTEEVLYLLAGYALQADLGDYLEETHTGTYFKPEEYLPQQVSSMVYSRSLFSYFFFIYKRRLSEELWTNI